MIGQSELSIREYEGKGIGYVHLFYLIAEKRGNGLGHEIQQYAMRFFKKTVCPNTTSVFLQRIHEPGHSTRKTE
ncbi:hypothetical protein ABWW58_14415 [Sporolactobacillus sp. STCC-11]|uniref:hypothetical protein n=1 Tax=Sporolactobacillus caesalpiniae TaxID=3230362 RepID=UPI00339A8FF6